jgi:hypothetical protein
MKNTEALVVASKEIGLEVYVDTIQCMVIPCDQNAERSRNVKFDISFEGVLKCHIFGNNLNK